MDYKNITLKKYCKNLFGVAMIGLGAFFIVEHIWSWGEFSFFDFIGHEWLGLLLILIGIIINLNFKTKLSSELTKK